MSASWLHLAAIFGASFSASLVEFVEALTIVLAVGVTRGWRSAIAGTIAGVLVLVAMVSVFGPSLEAIPVRWLQLGIGILVFVFGFRWLTKAVKRAAGVIPLHDEELIYQREIAELRVKDPSKREFDGPAFLASFKAILLEGVEVVFIVITTGTTLQNLPVAACGAVSAGLIVVLLGLILHRPLSRVPENTLKFAVGVLLTSFGIFWLGEGAGIEWPLGDVFLFGLVAGILGLSGFAVRRLKRRALGDGRDERISLNRF